MRMHAYRSVSNVTGPWARSADNAWLSVDRTLTLYALSGLYATVSRDPYNQKQMSCPVSSYLVCTSNQQRCAHSRISQFATSAMWQRRGRNRADNVWLDVGQALNIICGQSVASRLIRNRCHVLSVLINDAAGVAPSALQRGRTHACISLRQQYDSAPRARSADKTTSLKWFCDKS